MTRPDLVGKQMGRLGEAEVAGQFAARPQVVRRVRQRVVVMSYRGDDHRP